MNRWLLLNVFTNPNSQRHYGNAAGALLLGGVAVVTTAIGCGWNFVNEHSVRFSGYNSAGDFTRLQPLPVNPEARLKNANRRYNEEAEYDARERRNQEMNELWTEADDAEEMNDFARTGRLLREYLQRSSAEDDDGQYGEERRLRRNSAIDRLDALTALGQGVEPSALAAYLDARRVFDRTVSGVGEMRASGRYGSPGSQSDEDPRFRWTTGGNQLMKMLEDVPRRQPLADNVSYLRSTILYRTEKINEAANAFYDLVARYPHSEKREAALLMAGLAYVKLFEQTLQEADNESDQSRRRAKQSARQALRQCLRDYPRGRFAFDARGWLARLSLLEGDRAAALTEYYRLLAEATDAPTRQSLLASLRLTRHHASAEEKRQVESELTDEAAAALTYAYHTLYNYAPNAGYYLLDCKGEYDSMDEKKETDFSRQAERQEQERVVAFATNLIRRYPNAAMSGGFALRLAQAQLELSEYKAALQSSIRALRLGVNNRERLEALWVKGSSEWRLGEFAAARRTLKQLIAEFPQSDLAEGAGRLIAMAAEDAGDLDGALEQYIALNYEDDFAYFADVLMTPEQLAGFISNHPNSPRLNDLNYALVVRYLRAKRWAEARAALTRVKVTEQDYVEVSYAFEESEDPVEFRSTGRTVKTPSDTPGIAARWLWRDSKTAQDMLRLDCDVIEAKGDEAKAEALYQLASYLYQSTSLLFYNPSLWDGVRHYKLEELESGNGYRAPGEAQLLWRHSMEHEPVAHALEIYLDVARRFPNTRAARDALYTAAVCHERLSDYNNHWRNVYRMGLHAGIRMVAYEDVRQAYPNYQLPRGTIGWEPVTRTVYGGPGWTDKPNPKPRPSWSSRVKQRLANLAVELHHKKRDVDARFMNIIGRLVTGLIYSLAPLGLLAACFIATVRLYIKNQQPMFASIFEEERIATTASDYPASSTDSRVEKINIDP